MPYGTSLDAPVLCKFELLGSVQIYEYNPQFCKLSTPKLTELYLMKHSQWIRSIKYTPPLLHIAHPPWHTYKVHTEQDKVIPSRWLNWRSSCCAFLTSQRLWWAGPPFWYDTCKKSSHLMWCIEELLSSDVTHPVATELWHGILRSSAILSTTLWASQISWNNFEELFGSNEVALHSFEEFLTMSEVPLHDYSGDATVWIWEGPHEVGCPSHCCHSERNIIIPL